jgi:hypothetical protein
MPTIEWVTPAPLWPTAHEAGPVAFQRPRLVKLSGDDFLPAFLDAMTGPNADPGAFFADTSHDFGAAEDKNGTTLKLYHPAHGRYYLAVGSLICRQLGLPDRAVARQNGESASFVIRRRVKLPSGATREEAWVDEGPLRGWQPLVDARGAAVAVRPDEEHLPLHPVSSVLQRPAPSGFRAVVGGASGGSSSGVRLLTSGSSGPFAALMGETRTLFYGYIPVGYREKYTQRRPVAVTGTPAQILADYQADVRAASTVDKDFDYRMDEVTSRVLGLWGDIMNPSARAADRLGDTGGNERLPTVSLYLILDLADWLARYVPEVFDAVLKGTTLAGKPELEAVRDALTKIIVKTTPAGDSETTIKLSDAIAKLKDKLDLVRGVGTEPADKYNIRDATFPENVATYLPPAPPPHGKFHDLLAAALAKTAQPAQPPSEVVDLLKDQVTLEPPDDAPTAEATYFLRFVYERMSSDGRTPCEPEVSAASDTFTLARYFDPDAPARHIRIQLPSIKMQDLRKFKRGVGLEMSPELRDVANRIQKSMLDGEGLADAGAGWELGMICSFSLQIIFLVAFIVMFIFLIALNFIFWWLPFLKICFPIPRKSGG